MDVTPRPYLARIGDPDRALGADTHLAPAKILRPMPCCGRTIIIGNTSLTGSPYAVSCPGVFVDGRWRFWAPAEFDRIRAVLEPIHQPAPAVDLRFLADDEDQDEPPMSPWTAHALVFLAGLLTGLLIWWVTL